MQQLGAVGLVLLMLWATAWLLKRKAGTPLLSPRARAGARRIEELDRTRLTPQHSVHLIRIDDKTVVLAVHPGGLAVIDAVSPTLGAQATSVVRCGER